MARILMIAYVVVFWRKKINLFFLALFTRVFILDGFKIKLYLRGKLRFSVLLARE